MEREREATAGEGRGGRPKGEFGAWWRWWLGLGFVGTSVKNVLGKKMSILGRGCVLGEKSCLLLSFNLSHRNQ